LKFFFLFTNLFAIERRAAIWETEVIKRPNQLTGCIDCVYTQRKRINDQHHRFLFCWKKSFFFPCPYCWWWCGLLWPVRVKLRIKTWWKMFLWRLNRPVITWFSLSVVPLSLSLLLWNLFRLSLVDSFRPGC
jgi:hypothetical protein